MMTMKRIVTMLLVLTMLFGMVACGAQPEMAQKPDSSVQTPQQEAAQPSEKDTLTRQDQELIAELIGGEQNPEDLSDEALTDLIDQLLQDATEEERSEIVDLGNTQKEPVVDNSANEDAYDENGAMNTPFDQVYPELIEKEEVAFSDESLLIKLENDTLTDGLKAAGIGALDVVVPMNGCAWYEAKLVSDTDAQAALAAVRQLKEVLLAEYNYEIQTAALDDYKHFDDKTDEEFQKNGHNKDQWHFHHCGIPDGYTEMDTEGGLPSVVVAVIDSGVDYDHEDLADNMWLNAAEIPDNGIDDDGNGYIDDYYGIDLIAGEGSADDDNGHGTHVAGIIAAKNNNVGVVGIAYNVKIMPIKAAMHNGTLNQADIARAVLYAYEMGAEVINMSFGGTACSIAVQDALATAYTRCVLVASAGNSGKPNQESDFDDPLPNYPAALSYVLGVMSVDENGVESGFTNWDTTAFNGIEYELYAPGENIMSTLPGDRYGFLSGTSMAAPVVSAMAAILRSEFSDRDMYPTKFIYGQLASTSDYYADCVSPKTHTVNGALHNLPQIVDLNAALTKLPKPEVSMQDYAIFDSTELSDQNNGDGVIDAGETIALGLTLRNRWGMSENTLVTIDTLEDGIADPYVEIVNPTVDYGSVGTYSTGDCGKIMTDGMHTGWENPFIIKIADNIPNDYRMTFHVKITCENALDEADETVYISGENPPINIDLTARNGVILPSIIEEDMVLTSDNLYIIPNSTVITEGTTVRVEPGTHIQFWSDDASDPYASSYIAYLLVNGKFLVEGTKEAPVYIYPSQLMDRYGVEIGASTTGFVSLKYADVTNLFYASGNDHTGTGNNISYAEHCTFRSNYPNLFYYRTLKNGTVSRYNTDEVLFGIINAKDCVFYKLNHTSNFGNMAMIKGQLDRCVFTQCAMGYSTSSSSIELTNCVFLDNSLNNVTSVYNAKNPVLPSAGNFTVWYREETGTTYLSSITAVPVEWLSAVNGDWVVIETEEERAWLQGYTAGSYYYIGSYYDGEKHVWSDGSAFADFVDPNGVALSTKPGRDVRFYNGEAYTGSTTNSRYLYEIPGQILPEQITFGAYEVAIDMESTYQLAPMNTPVQLPLNGFLYESTDETVLTVSDTGLVTPVGLGTADVYVYSLDRAVSNFVSVEVKDYVALEGIAFPVEAAEVAAGESLKASCLLTPADTTRRNVVYTSSNEAVATVDKGGIVTGVSSGTATITATCEGLTATMELTVYTKATSLDIAERAVVMSLDQTPQFPEVIASQGAALKLQWESSDEEVLQIVDNGIVLHKAGWTKLSVTDLLSGLRDSVEVYVREKPMSQIVDIIPGYYNIYTLTEDGRLYALGGYNTTPGKAKCILEGVKHAYVDTSYRHDMFLAMQDGSLALYKQSKLHKFTVKGIDEEIVDVCAYIAYSDNHEYDYYFVLTESGKVYNFRENAIIWEGSDSETAEAAEYPKQILINDPVAEILYGGKVLYLAENGNLYLGHESGDTPQLIARDVTYANGSGSTISYISNGYGYNYDGSTGTYYETNVYYGQYELIDFANVSSTSEAPYAVIFNNGILSTVSGSSKYDLPVNGEPVVVKGVIYNGFHVYMAAADGLLYYWHGLSDDQTSPIVEMDPVEETLKMTGTNLTQNGVLTENEITITFNKDIQSAKATMTENGTPISVQNVIEDNVLSITFPLGFAENDTYTVTIPAATTYGRAGTMLDEDILLEFTYQAPDSTDGDTTEEVVIHESQLDESVERIPTPESLAAELLAYVNETQLNPQFYGNAILNPIATDTDVTHWLRPLAPTVSAGTYSEIPLGGNYWGTANETAVQLQMTDYTDFVTYARLMYAPYLTEAPENTFPFVTSVTLLNKYGEPVTTVGNEEVTFRVTFNRDMDTSIPLQLRFGSAYPYGDYEVQGAYVDARTWEGKYTLNTLIENGNQFIAITNGCSATEDLALQLDEARFGFVIDTSAAQALIMQGHPTDTGIELTWTQDDFDTLMGYNVYRSTKEDGLYTRLNSTVIPADTMTWFDDTVEPGVVYYYNFTVVQTDLTESEPSGKISLMSKDTMAPNIYHSPVASAFTGANLVITATVTDNLSIAYANLYYRIAGTDSWKTVRMNKLNDKYSAILPAADVTVDGIEYYIEAFDGVSYTYKGSAEAPFAVAVSPAVEASDLGDVDGDGAVTLRDAMVLLYAINDKYNMTAEEFARADLNGDGELWAAEALRILQYVNGTVGSLKLS